MTDEMLAAPLAWLKQSYVNNLPVIDAHFHATGDGQTSLTFYLYPRTEGVRLTLPASTDFSSVIGKQEQEGKGGAS